MKILKKFHAWRINRAQEKVNELMKSEGFSDKVLEKQVSINKKRAKYGISDQSKIIKDEFVQ